jgi:hypothetical protein
MRRVSTIIRCECRFFAELHVIDPQIDQPKMMRLTGET